MSTLLVVDDEKNIRELYRNVFQKEGHRVMVASNAEEGKQKLNEEDVDLLLLDLWMKREDGLDMLKEVKSTYPELKILIVSAYPIYKDDFITWMADDFVVKSPNLDELKEKVNSLLAK